MASLHYVFAPMNAGKSTHLLQVNHNYKSQNMTTLLLKPVTDTRNGNNISSRLGLSQPAIAITNENYNEIYKNISEEKYDCILVDEAQFLSREIIVMLSEVVDKLQIPVMCYGLRTDYMGNLFTGSKALFELADKLQELKTVCHCGRKATFVILKDGNGNVIKKGEQIHIGDSEYESVCRKHWKEARM